FSRFGLASLEQEAEPHSGRNLLRRQLVENRYRQAVEFAVRTLGHHLVDNLRAWVIAYPAGENLAQLLTVFGLRRGEDLGPQYHSRSSFLAEILKLTGTNPQKACETGALHN